MLAPSERAGTLLGALRPAGALLGALLLLAPTPGSTATLPPIGHTALSAPAELPLLAGPAAQDHGLYIEARAGDRTLLLRLATGHNTLRLSPATAAGLGLHVHGKPDHGTARVPTLHLGALVVDHAKAHVGPVAPSGAVAVDGEIGLAGLPEIDWALLPSQGVVRLAPAGALSATTSGGITVDAADFRRLDRRRVRRGVDHVTVDRPPVLATVEVSGVPIVVTWCLECSENTLAREWTEPPVWRLRAKRDEGTPAPPMLSSPALPPAAGYTRGVVGVEWREVALAGVTTSTWVARPGQGLAWGSEPPGVIGVDVAYRHDLTVDALRHRSTLAPVGTPRLASSIPGIEARLRQRVDEARHTTDERTDASTRGASVPGPDAAIEATRALSMFYLETGRLTDALPLWEAATRAFPDRCDALLELGRVQLSLGTPRDAVPSFTRADALYHPWAIRPLAERTDLRADHARALAHGRTWSGPVPQPPSCDAAVGLLAEAHIAAHEREQVARLYPARLDLDPTLPRAAGLAALASGRNQAAEAAFLQALHLRRGGEDAAARIGLFFARSAHDPEGASGQLARIRYAWGGATDPLLVRRQAEIMRDGTKAVSVLSAALTHLPEDPVLLTQLGIEQRRVGDGAAATTFAEAAARYRALLAVTPGDGALHAGYALLLDAQTRPTEARTEAETATRLAPGAAVTWYTLAEVARSAGDPAAAEHRRRAARIGVDHPGYALLVE